MSALRWVFIAVACLGVIGSLLLVTDAEQRGADRAARLYSALGCVWVVAAVVEVLGWHVAASCVALMAPGIHYFARRSFKIHQAVTA